ncbi:MAG: DUF3048 domain-containing protein [Clostridiales bacterium]|jgi:hypothetical protein|nr:DUF3048 domain-containing protein [Clostridiales bacterium]
MRRKLAVLLLFMIVFLSACGGKQEHTPTPEPTAEPTALPSPVLPEETPEPTPYNGPVNPLTGMPVSEDISGLRPLAIMLNNIYEALPQHGIGKADIIYETLAEGGITRMLAIYQDITGAGKIGSIRSARSYYLDLAQGHDAIFIHAGGSPQAYDEIYSRGVSNIDGVNGNYEIFYRNKERANYSYEHTLFSTDELINEYLPTYSIRREHPEDYSYKMLFADDGTPENGESAQVMKVKFSDYKTGVFEYDPQSGLYMASQYGEIMADGNTGEQVGVKNLLVLYASVGNLENDAYGRIAIDLTGSGKGLFASGGKYIPITWKKDGYTSQFEYFLEDGTDLIFGRGSTYICIVPINSKVEIN